MGESGFGGRLLTRCGYGFVWEQEDIDFPPSVLVALVLGGLLSRA